VAPGYNTWNSSIRIPEWYKNPGTVPHSPVLKIKPPPEKIIYTYNTHAINYYLLKSAKLATSPKS
jgi:hypothetical protein